MARRCIVDAIRRNAGILGSRERADESAQVEHSKPAVAGTPGRVERTREQAEHIRADVGGYIRRGRGGARHDHDLHARGYAGAADGYSGLRASSGPDCGPVRA